MLEKQNQIDYKPELAIEKERGLTVTPSQLESLIRPSWLTALPKLDT